MFICMYVCMHVCTKSFLKTTTNSSCVCTHLANKADSDSDSDSDLDITVHDKDIRESVSNHLDIRGKLFYL